ncbi:PDZK1-interacting protein 1 [Pempheris klunzingeri]|uniref:PDZK1-interacting protein 1 n=1 Tax=Pempheris klunzingeri TaxID=3127111 RepID=UPI0039805B2B
MGKLCAVTSCLLLAVGAVTAQTAQNQSERLLPQWLTGIIAVVGFLFLTFVGFLVKKAWCEEPSRRKETVRENDFIETNDNNYETSLDLDQVRRKRTESVREDNTYETHLDLVRSKEHENAYDNLVTDVPEEKATAM